MTLTFARVDSYSELIELLRRSARHIILGDSDESHREYWIATDHPCAVGICSQGHGIPPKVLQDPSRVLYWIGLNSRIACVDIEAGQVNCQCDLPCIFREFINLMSDGSVVVLHELGVVRANLSGELVWCHHASDLVTHFEVGPNTIQIHSENGVRELIDEETGRILEYRRGS
jgi:hypothetical protein